MLPASFDSSDRIGDEDFATTFKRADNALYSAKESGRNCCIIAKDLLDGSDFLTG